jgi:hypothetical protein
MAVRCAGSSAAALTKIRMSTRDRVACGAG